VQKVFPSDNGLQKHTRQRKKLKTNQQLSDNVKYKMNKIEKINF